MSSEVEMDDLSNSHRNTRDQDESPSPINRDSAGSAGDSGSSTLSSWSWTSTVLVSILAVVLILFPRVLLFTAETSNERRSSLTPLESFLALHFGIFLTALALALIVNIPSPSPVTRPQDAQYHPLLIPLTGSSVLTAFISYNTTSVGSLSFLMFLGSAVIGLYGLWVIVFAGEGLVSKKTGADKHTSAFLFGNKSAASAQKKRWRKEQDKFSRVSD